MNLFKWLSLIFLLILSLSCLTNGQDSATDDASQDTGQDTAASDPNLVNTPKNEGYGNNVRTSLRKTSPMKSVTVQQKTIAEQSVLAMQQFGILVIIRDMTRGINKTDYIALQIVTFD